MPQFDERKLIIEGRKVMARALTLKAIKSGAVKREPCLHCGSENAAAHHSEVVWLCGRCHSKHHIRLRRYSETGYAVVPLRNGNLDIKAAVENLEKDLIPRALLLDKGNKSAAAKLLGISHPTILYKIKNYRLQGEEA